MDFMFYISSHIHFPRNSNKNAQYFIFNFSGGVHFFHARADVKHGINFN